jgi:hypothetical protein
MILLTLVLLTAELPHPGRLVTAGYASLVGGFIGSLIGRLLGRSRERVDEMTKDGAFVGCGIALAGWLIVVATDVL